MKRLLAVILALFLLVTPAAGQELKKQMLLSSEYWGETPNFPLVGDENRTLKLEGLQFKAPLGKNWIVRPFAAAPSARAIEGHAFGANAVSDPKFSRFHLLYLNLLTGETTQQIGDHAALRTYAKDRVSRIAKNRPSYQNCSFSEEESYDLPKGSILSETTTVKWLGACEDSERGFKTTTHFIIYYFYNPDNQLRVYKMSLHELVPEGEQSFMDKYELEAGRIFQTINFLPLAKLRHQ